MQIDLDMRDVAAEDVQGFDAVIHLAGLSNDPLGDYKPDLTEEINEAAAVRLARLAKAAGVSASCSPRRAATTARAGAISSTSRRPSIR